MAKEGNRRKTGKEQYYTLPKIADFCVEILFEFVGIENRFLEPAGGEGSFIDALLRKGVPEDSIISFDIEPRHVLVKQQDFLTLGPKEIGFGYVTITNPPFGRANSLSKKFFNQCAEVSNYIGFLVPKSWRKWSVHNSLNNRFHLIKDVDLPEVCFYSASGEIYNNGNLNTIFQIWKLEKEEREKIKIIDHKLIEKTTPEKADIAMIIFGWSCGKILREFDRVKNTTMIFLKVRDESVIKALEELDFSQFSENVAYTQALSLQEINWLLNRRFKLG